MFETSQTIFISKLSNHNHIPDLLNITGPIIFNQTINSLSSTIHNNNGLSPNNGFNTTHNNGLINNPTNNFKQKDKLNSLSKSLVQFFTNYKRQFNIKLSYLSSIY